MGLAVLVWWRSLPWLFFTGVTPVILLAAVGTTLELSGRPTCPLSNTGLPLCYVSLVMGCSLLLAFLLILSFEKKINFTKIES
jgi:hypothetical protein